MHPAYFPDIVSFAVMMRAGEVVWDIHAHFDKQTYRNRMYIHAAHGKQMLSVPVRHAKGMERRAFKDVEVSGESDWQRYHWKSLETAYRTSPYFEFYEDDLKPFFEKKFRFLLDVNKAALEKILELADIDLSLTFTERYDPSPADIADFRFLVDAKKRPVNTEALPSYTQVFSDRNGFIPGLSILDLLFMEGPKAVLYLKNLDIDKLLEKR